MALRAILKKLTGSSLAGAGATTMVLSGFTLVINLLTGVLVARALDPDGRGEVTAALVAVQTIGWLSSIGARGAIGYRVAREPESSADLLATWLVVWGGLSVVGVGLVELLLPTLQGAQSTASLNAARLYAPTLAFICLTEVMSGFMLGHQRFFAWNRNRFLGPVVLVVAYLVLLVTGAFSVGTALAANALSLGAVAVSGYLFVRREFGQGRPRRELAKSTLGFGLRSHMGSLSSSLNSRLDLLIMPAILSATSVGLYAVATNTASIVFTLTGTVSYLTLPAAVRRKERGPTTVITVAAATLLVGVVLAIPLGILAPTLIPLLYGGDFDGAVLPLVLLLPGAVFFSPANVLIAGLSAQNRPGLGSFAPTAAAVVTVVGLLVFLRAGGPEAAALVSTASYLTTFLVALVLFKRTTGLPWSELGRTGRSVPRLIIRRVRPA